MELITYPIWLGSSVAQFMFMKPVATVVKIAFYGLVRLPTSIVAWVLGVDLDELFTLDLKYVFDIVRVFYQFVSVALLFGLFIGAINGLVLCLVRYLLTFKEPAIKIFESSSKPIRTEQDTYVPPIKRESGTSTPIPERIDPVSRATSFSQIYDESQHQLRERHTPTYYEDDDGYNTIRSDFSPKTPQQSRVSSRYSSVRSDSLFNTPSHQSESSEADTTIEADRSRLNIIKEEDVS
ncbi:hypothetical protein OGAPHI_003620 [Ogataea philodendri]|uniref:Uncharacterized protein n=1 Tax=Ogataea philodendri TaxID=1378263 RepID=A0A9P8T510_9ASCO|nr:uncharacterized protein OGAPHI_003620 [Ogataea philodendri]KAH3665436.1 hypothetical protein OGAPHI_003620 [Ogataea philodendri]